MKKKETLKSSSLKSFKERHDVFLWAGGMAFLVILIGAMFGLGEYRGWNAESGFTHNESKTSQERFWTEPYIEEPGVKGRYGVDADARWYYWKLPPTEVRWYTRFFPWVCYVFHQVMAWTVIFIAQNAKNDLKFSEKFSSKLSKWNIIAFSIHVFFHVLHLVQTHVTYDGLTQDTTITSSQGAMTMVLVYIILMEYRNRGLVFGWPSLHNTDRISEKLKMSYDPVIFIRKYHPYGFAWAAIYNFWYHPLENTWGHAMGLFHNSMLLLQGSLFFTKVHLNRYWRLVLEAWVLLHALVVAFQTGGPDLKGTKLWPMFTFGFAFILVFTQVFLLRFWQKIHVVFRFVPVTIFLAVVLYMYSWIPDKDGRTWVRLHEILRIPAFYYLFFFYAWALLFVLVKVYRKLHKNKDKAEPSALAKCLTVVVFVCSYGGFVVLSVLVEWYDVQQSNIVLSAVIVAVFVTGVAISSVFMAQIVPPTKEFERYDDEDTSRNKYGLNSTDTPHVVTKF